MVSLSVITSQHLVGAGAGFVIGAFTPKVGRSIKAGLVAVAKKIVAAGEAEIKKAEVAVVAAGEAEIKKV
jgi:hypothetical protein